LAPAREILTRASSALAHQPASSVSASAAASSQPAAFLPGLALRAGLDRPVTRIAAAVAFRAPGGQQPVLQAEHGRMLVRLGVVIPEQVQDAVRAQQVELVLHAVIPLPGLHDRHLGAQHHVTEQGLADILVRAVLRLAAAGRRRAQLVHGEGKHVGRPGLPQPALMQVGHGRLVHQQHGELGQRMHPHTVQHVPGQGGQPGLVDRHARLVGDLDAHVLPPRPQRARLPVRRDRPPGIRSVSPDEARRAS
jgi:hypothetical protein